MGIKSTTSATSGSNSNCSCGVMTALIAGGFLDTFKFKNKVDQSKLHGPWKKVGY